MVLVSEFNERSNSEYKIYLETYPYKICDMDFGIILDSGFEMARDWIQSIRWIPRSESDNIFKYFSEGGNIWLTDRDNQEHLLNRDIMIKGISRIMLIHKSEVVNYKKEINAPCISNMVCDEIIQLALYNDIKY